MINEPQKVFEDLPRNERMLLRNEFSDSVEMRFKIYLWSGFGLLFLSLISEATLIYYMINNIFTGFVSFQFYIYTAMLTVGGYLSLLLTSQYHKRFSLWLKENKNITSRIIQNKKDSKKL